MAEITLEKSLSLLSSDKQRDRSDGLADLKHILQQNKQTSKLNSLNDKACHKIFESLFRLISAERSTYNRSNAKGASGSRLAACASVIRTAVDALLRNLRIRSVRAIVDHITDVLLVPGDGLFDLLVVDYTKCLTALLHYPPHREHLGNGEWERILDFCLKCIIVEDNDGRSSRSSNDHRSTLEGYLNAGNRSSTPSRMTPALPVRERSSGSKSAVAEAITCIQLLTTCPNAPIQDASERLLRGLAKFLQGYPMPGAAHQAAIKSINSITMRIFFDQSEFSRSFLFDLIPTIQHLWNTKLMGLKDELLVTLMLCMVVLTDSARQEPSESLLRTIDDLTNTLYSEYTRRPEKETLQVDEVIFSQKMSDSQHAFTIWPRLESSRSEHNWTVVWVIANLMKLSEQIVGRLSSPRAAGETSTKRPRQMSVVEDVYRDSTLSSGVRRICALHLIPFLSDMHTSAESKASLLQRLTPNILDDNGLISSWTMIAIASLTGLPEADSQSLRTFWKQAWDLGSRASTSQTTSRAACALMDCLLQSNLLEYSAVAEATASMLSSVNLNGPSTMSDSSLALWATITRVTAQINPGSAPNAAKQVCAWLQQTWTIGTITERLQTAQVATFARPLDLLNLILASTNRSFTLPKSQFRGVTGLVARGWHFYYKNGQLLNYMFDLESLTGFVEPWFHEETIFLEQFNRQDPNDNVVLDLLQSKSEAFLQAWRSLCEEKSQHITGDVMQILVSFCILISLYTQCLPQKSASRSEVLHENSQSLWESLCSFLASRGHDFVQIFLGQISPFLGPNAFSLDTHPVISLSLSRLVPPLARVLESHRKDQQGFFASEEEPMDLDDPLMNSNDRHAEASRIINMNREALLLFRDAATFQRSVTIQLSVFERIHEHTSDTGEPVAGGLISYLTDLDETDILSAREFLPHIYRACSGLERSSLLQLLEDLGEKCLQTYELERCENSHILCIQMMHSFVKSWTTGQSDDFSDSASDIYTWFTDVLLAKGRASSSVLSAFTDLLGEVISCNTLYAGGQSNPSPRTSLFMALQEGDVPAKFNAGTLIPQLFGQYPLTDHDAIFDDVLESLPRDPDWTEGIALRLYILAQLASQWHTLLRRSIYHIFETPAQVPPSLWYAERCVRNVANSLGLRDAKELFRLFSSQILYTWTETQTVTAMPFSIFGYVSIEDMLIDVQDEIVGQIMMRARDQDASEVSNRLGTAFVDLLAQSFYKAEAYSLARDLSTPPSQGSQPKGVENRMKKTLGTDRFSSLIDQQFPQAIATFFGSLDQYEQIERAFLKRPNYHNALDTLRRIVGKSSSTIVLPANQQPSFRARFLLDELEFLCKRSGYDMDTIWTPALVSYVCRTLLESIHPALGSLHACAVIRKIRILVSVAGPVILSDYPLEMILHALQPFLTDIYCSEDTLGVFWYLLEAGKDYLAQNLGLMAGIAVPTILSCGKFLTSSRENTKQEAQLSAVSGKIEGFLQWFEDYLDTYQPPDPSGASQELFRRLMKSSREQYLTAQDENENDDSDLLSEVLHDRNSTQSLLSKPVSDHIISLLCADSKMPVDWQIDIVESSENAISNTAAVCQTLQTFDTGSRYKLWAARTIGRAFAATGTISDDLLREQDQALFKYPESPSPLEDFNYSKARIIEVLSDMLQKSNPREIGLVEQTLQLIVSNLSKYEDYGPCAQVIPDTLMKALAWTPYQCPAIPVSSEAREYNIELGWHPNLSSAHWARSVALFLSRSCAGDPVIGALSNIIFTMPELAAQLLPYILHDVLLAELHGEAQVRQDVSNLFKQALREVTDDTIPHARLIINCVLYLRNQPRPKESTIVQRDEWLDIDLAEASLAANKCRLPKTALIFLESHTSRVVPGTRRSSVARYEPPPDMLHEIFKNIDDPDFFYGVQQSSSLASVMETLEHESSGFKNLLFQSAQYDSDIQMLGGGNAFGVLNALNAVNLQGVASSMFSNAGGGTKDTSTSFDSMLQAATNLRQWDIPVSPLNPSPSATIFRAFQSLNTSSILQDATASIDECLLTTLDLVTSSSRSAMSLRTAMRVLGVMTEISDVLSVGSTEGIENEWNKITTRNSWLTTTSAHEVGEILNSQEALFASIKQRDYLKSAMHLSDHDAQLLEVKAIRQSLAITRKHGIPQSSLKSAVCLSKLSDQCTTLGINVEGAAKFDLANVLWDQGEMTASIQMLQQLKEQNDLHSQAVPISRAELLVTLGHHVAEARLEKPEAIIQEYLSQAVKELKNRSGGDEAGRVYHGFAMFCDQQLQNPDGLEDFKRVEQLRNRKEKEVQALEDMMKSADGKDRDALRYHRTKTKQWFDLDDREYQRLLRSRESFLRQCLENYLLCLKEGEAYNNDALRFCALWLDKSDSDIANEAVSKFLHQVPSRKFAPLMNQLSSRLLDVEDDFQKMLFSLIYRICVEHPFHGMYQIFASSKSKGSKDESALSRNRAAGRLVEGLKNDKRIGPTWVAVHNTNINYVRFAIDRPSDKLKSGAKVPLKKLSTGARLEQDAATQRLPPPTMHIDIRVDCEYSDVPKLTRYSPEFTIASGVSAPKIVSAWASNGQRYKQLFKGGNDDLRQDAIMEQVFEQVSSLLKDHQATRQRNLGIRTYKVLPLTSNAGIIEFVPHTIPLHDYLMPAHQRYFPKDMKPNVCRKHIGDVQTRSFEQRVRTYRQVTEHFHPVMRYFFMEKFNNPDDWFGKRLAYTRSTAAISILGHVLGLGDRHGHNILLDERTGEVVHIDLGVAFEQGRVLPVPEVVPFRLTRDLVDGMGITKTEGVFRRCCEFTLEALRQESYSIMTILDVLRYDPLYSWTVSPLRMKKMQDASEAAGEPLMPPGPGAVDKRQTNEPSEADRALTVVAKKLSKTLSVTATVNELIQQATDEKNLAVLYCGWAAYA